MTLPSNQCFKLDDIDKNNVTVQGNQSTMSYTGGKNGSGVYQKIISMMPPHTAYFELFLGHGAILRKKKPANLNVGVEIDPGLREFWEQNKKAANNIIFDDVFNFLDRTTFAPDSLVYCDPPYLKEVRRSKKKLYNFEMMGEPEHVRLLEKLLKLDCMVMISGYDSDLYNSLLSTWRKETFTTTNRAGSRTIETVWLNFPKPFQLHDYSFLGETFRERERIKRKRERWKQRLLRLDSTEMYSLMATIDDLKINLQ